MDRLSDILFGYAAIKAVGAEPTRILDRCAEKNIEFWEAFPEDAFTMRFRTSLKKAEEVCGFAERCCCEAEITERRGPGIWAKRLKKRYVLWVLPVILLLALIASSFFIWRIDITGNVTVSDIEIRNALEDSGVKIGSYWPAFTSDIIRSRVLVKVPELKWISVSVFGSRAQVVVRERTEIPKVVDEDEAVKIIAKESGIIEKMSIFRGLAEFKKGQTAAKSDVLVAGAVPSIGSGTRIVHAEGSVIARTWYELTAIMPLNYEKKEYTGRGHTRFALIIGSRRINFYGNSRIPDADCDNIIEKHTLGIDGLFELPITIVREKTKYYVLETAQVDEETAKSELEALLNGELKYSVGENGEIKTNAFTCSVVDGYAVGTLRAECRQDIAEEKEMTESEINAALTPKEEEKAND